MRKLDIECNFYLDPTEETRSNFFFFYVERWIYHASVPFVRSCRDIRGEFERNDILSVIVGKLKFSKPGNYRESGRNCIGDSTKYCD